jgi:Zn-dependent M28 family amino/carboxypeptidase
VGVVIRSVGTSINRLPHTGSLSYASGVPKIPAAALSHPDADLLARLLKGGKPVRLRFRLACGDRPDAVSQNILGEVAGRELPEEIVVVSCHIDSWDLGTGAVDDGAGCAIAIETARLISTSPQRPRRTVRVVLFANEESGLAGGRTYAVEHAAELPKHVAAFEADSGTEKPTGFSWNAGPSARGVIGEIARLLEPIMIPKVEEGGGGGADISPLLKAGVPLLGLSQETARYFDIHHSADDTFDKIEKAHLDQATAALAALVYAVADLPERLAPIPEGSRVRKRP